MDALSAVAASSQLAGQALGIIWNIVRLYKQAKKAAETVARQNSQLQQVRSLVDEIKKDLLVRTPSMSSVLVACRETLSLIVQKLSKIEAILKRRKFWGFPADLRASLKVPEVEELFDRLARIEWRLGLCMQHQSLKLLQNLPSPQQPTGIQPNPQKSRLIWLVPNRPVQLFVGRDSTLEKLHKILGEGGQRSSNQLRAVLRGMGGLGKSQIAYEYCRQNRELYGDDFDAILWVDASSEASLKGRYEELAACLSTHGKIPVGSKEKVDFTINTLTRFKRGSLIVFDNFDEPDVFHNIEDYVPCSSACSVLFTSRHGDSKHLVVDPDVAYLELEGLEHEAAQELLLRLASCKSETDREQAGSIVQRLCHHPLAIVQAAGFIDKRRIPLSRFDEHYQKSKRSILEYTPSLSKYRKRFSDQEYDVALNVFTTWELSHQQLERRGATGKGYSELLHLSAFVGGSQISEDLFRVYCEQPKWDPEPNLGLTKLVQLYSQDRAPVEGEAAEDAHRTNLDDEMSWELSFRGSHEATSDVTVRSEIQKGTVAGNPDQKGKQSTYEAGHPSQHVWSQDCFAESLTVLHDIALLQDYDFSDGDNMYSFSLHPLIQDWLRLRCSFEDYKTKFAMACTLVGYYLYATYSPETRKWEISASETYRVLDHLRTLHENLKLWHDPTEVGDRQLAMSSLPSLEGVSSWITMNSMWAMGVGQFSLASNIVDQLLPRSNPQLLINTGTEKWPQLPFMPTLQLFTLLYEEDFVNLEPLVHSYSSLCQRSFEPETLEAVTSLFFEAHIQLRHGRRSDAFHKFKKAANVARRVGRSAQFLAIICQTEEAILCACFGQSDLCERILNELLQECERDYSRSSGVAVGVQFRFGMQLMLWIRPVEALPLFRACANIALETFGADNGVTSEIVEALAVCLDELDKRDDALWWIGKCPGAEAGFQRFEEYKAKMLGRRA